MASVCLPSGALLIDLRPPEGDNETDDSLRHVYLHSEADINVERIKNMCVALAGIGVNVCGQQVQAIQLQRITSDASMTVAMLQAEAVLLVVMLPGPLPNPLAAAVAAALSRHLQFLLGPAGEWLRHCSRNAGAAGGSSSRASRSDGGGPDLCQSGTPTTTTTTIGSNTSSSMGAQTSSSNSGSSSALDQLMFCFFSRMLPLLAASPSAAQLLLQYGPPLMPCGGSLQLALGQLLGGFVALAPPWLPLVPPPGQQQQLLPAAVALFNRYQVVSSSMCPWATSAVWHLAWQLGVLDRTSLHPPAALVQEAFLQLHLDLPAAATTTTSSSAGGGMGLGGGAATGSGSTLTGSTLLQMSTATLTQRRHWGQFVAGGAAAGQVAAGVLGDSSGVTSGTGQNQGTSDVPGQGVLVPCTLVLLCLGPHVLAALVDRRQLNAANATQPGPSSTNGAGSAAAAAAMEPGQQRTPSQTAGAGAGAGMATGSSAATAACAAPSGAAGGTGAVPLSQPQPQQQQQGLQGASLLQQLLQQFTGLVQQWGPALEAASSSSAWVAACATALQPPALAAPGGSSVATPTAGTPGALLSPGGVHKRPMVAEACHSQLQQQPLGGERAALHATAEGGAQLAAGCGSPMDSFAGSGAPHPAAAAAAGVAAGERQEAAELGWEPVATTVRVKKHRGLLSALLRGRRRRGSSGGSSNSSSSDSLAGGVVPGSPHGTQQQQQQQQQGSPSKSDPSSSPGKVKVKGKHGSHSTSNSKGSSSPSTPTGLLSRLASMTLQHQAAGIRAGVLAAALPGLIHTSSPSPAAAAGGAAGGGIANSGASSGAGGGSSSSVGGNHPSSMRLGASPRSSLSASGPTPPLALRSGGILASTGSAAPLHKLRKGASASSSPGTPTAAAAGAGAFGRPSGLGSGAGGGGSSNGFGAHTPPRHTRNPSLASSVTTPLGPSHQRTHSGSSSISSGTHQRTRLSTSQPPLSPLAAPGQLGSEGGLAVTVALSSRRGSRELSRSGFTPLKTKTKAGRIKRWLHIATGGLIPAGAAGAGSGSSTPGSPRTPNSSGGQHHQQHQGGGWEEGSCTGYREGGTVASVGCVGALLVDLAASSTCCSGPQLDAGVVQVLLHAAAQQLPRYQQHLQQLAHTLATAGPYSSSSRSSSSALMGLQQQQQEEAEAAAAAPWPSCSAAAARCAEASSSSSSGLQTVQQTAWDSSGSLCVTVGSTATAGGRPCQKEAQQATPAAAAADGAERMLSTKQQQQQVVLVGPSLQELELAAAAADAAQRLAPAAAGPWRRHQELLGALGGSCHVSLEVACTQGAFEGSTLLVTLCLTSLLEALQISPAAAAGSNTSSGSSTGRPSCCWQCRDAARQAMAAAGDGAAAAAAAAGGVAAPPCGNGSPSRRTSGAAVATSSRQPSSSSGGGAPPLPGAAHAGRGGRVGGGGGSTPGVGSSAVVLVCHGSLWPAAAAAAVAAPV